MVTTNDKIIILSPDARISSTYNSVMAHEQKTHKKPFD